MFPPILGTSVKDPQTAVLCSNPWFRASTGCPGSCLCFLRLGRVAPQVLRNSRTPRPRRRLGWPNGTSWAVLPSEQKHVEKRKGFLFFMHFEEKKVFSQVDRLGPSPPFCSTTRGQVEDMTEKFRQEKEGVVFLRRIVRSEPLASFTSVCALLETADAQVGTSRAFSNFYKVVLYKLQHTRTHKGWLMDTR